MFYFGIVFCAMIYVHTAYLLKHSPPSKIEHIMNLTISIFVLITDILNLFQAGNNLQLILKFSLVLV